MPVAQAIGARLEEAGGPLIWSGISEAEQDAFAATCRKYYRYLHTTAPTEQAPSAQADPTPGHHGCKRASAALAAMHEPMAPTPGQGCAAPGCMKRSLPMTRLRGCVASRRLCRVGIELTIEKTGPLRQRETTHKFR